MDTTINNIRDLERVLLCDSAEELTEFFGSLIYPVTLTYDEKSVTLATDADRVPFTKVLSFPFTEDSYQDAITELQCVTDYAMHEGYDRMHEDLFKGIALRHAEEIGVIEYTVNKAYMEYWSLYEDGFYFFRTDLNTLKREEVCHLPWIKEEGYPIPAFLLTEVKGFTKYNYFCG